ncbi:winged helix-turn-helix domain-containing protein [Streptomyces malaysiensis subsp. malaysiensis]
MRAVELFEQGRSHAQQGARAHGFEADLWTLERVGLVVERVSGVKLARASVWRLPTGRLGWSPRRPQRRAVERDESEIARWVTHEWPRIKTRLDAHQPCHLRRRSDLLVEPPCPRFSW